MSEVMSEVMSDDEPAPRANILWVDADACPLALRGILNKAARRTGVELVYVANHAIPVPADKNIRALRVAAGFDVADDEIVRSVQAGDLVVTGDIPLAGEVMAKGCEAVSPRGIRYDDDTIGQRLAVRDFMDTMRSSAVKSQSGHVSGMGGGPPPFGPKEKQAFANVLDRWLARRR